MNPISEQLPRSEQPPIPCQRHGVTNCMPCWQASIAAIRERDHAKLAQQQHRDRVEWLLARADIPERYADATLDVVDAEKAARMQAWLTRVKAGDAGSLIVVGSVGTGKTFAACGLVRAGCELGLLSRYTRTFDIAQEVKDTWGQRGVTEAQAIERFLAPRILVIDELGLGVPQAGDAERLHALIDARYMASKPTVFVTNLAPKGLQDHVGPRMYDRMREGAMGVDFTGKSRRLTSS